MKTIEWPDISPSEESPNLFYCDASDIGLPPGGWPHFLKTGLGNGKDFVKQYREADFGFIYQQEGGDLQLLVFND